MRKRWQAHQSKIDIRRLVFIDETWIKINMAPPRGWSLKGERLHAKVPHGHWRTLTFIAALGHDRIDTPCVTDGLINGGLFTAYVAQFLAPTLAPGDIVILDNLGSHKGKAARAAIRARGAHLIFLPSPLPFHVRRTRNLGRLRPTALTSIRSSSHSKVKHWMRDAQERDQDTTRRRVGHILNIVSPAEYANYLQNAGYASA